ncbi:MAG: copper chaperone PCu(A)C [Minwuia sp.]|uniref:copper chaperone PCu(A)C n=1 Tax=Minwuia sp. TaxID=2493630 RepID=UPI003A85F39B
MKTISFVASHVAAAAMLLFALSLNHGHAHEYKAGNIVIGHPYAFASIGQVPNGAGFLSLKNEGSEDDALIGVRSGFAARNELHTHINENGRMMMRPVERVEVPAGAIVLLEPGGHHLMLMGLDAPLKEGERRTVTLVFEKAGEIDVELAIEARKAGGGHGGHGSHN